MRYKRSIAIRSAALYVCSLIVFVAYWWHAVESDDDVSNWALAALLAAQFVAGFALAAGIGARKLGEKKWPAPR